MCTFLSLKLKYRTPKINTISKIKHLVHIITCMCGWVLFFFCVFLFSYLGNKDCICFFSAQNIMQVKICSFLFDAHVQIFVGIFYFFYHPSLHYCIPQLAKQGMNVVIMSRTKVTLDQVAKKIGKTFCIYLFLLCLLLKLELHPQICCLSSVLK